MNTVHSFTEYVEHPRVQGRTTSRYRTVSLTELRAMDLPARDMVLSPIIPAQGLTMVYAQRGIGKTQVGIGIAFAVATGGAFFRWRAEKPRKVLYVDGEMPARALQDRVNMLAPSGASMLHPDYFRFLPMDLQDLGTGCNLAHPEDQKAIEAEMDGVELVVFDNLSTLVSAGRENDAESWDAMQAWLLQLRRKGVSVLMIHHAGRGENARGTSKREDVLDTVIHLKRPENYVSTEGARFEVHLTKARGIFGVDAEPFEAKLETVNGLATWAISGIQDQEEAQVLDMSRMRVTVRDIAEELGISKSKVSRIQAKLKDEGKLAI